MEPLLRRLLRNLAFGALLFPLLQANAQTTFDLGVTTTKTGTEITLPLQIRSGSEPIGFHCEIRYEGTGVEMKPATAGSALAGHTVSTKLLSPNRQRIVVDSASAAVIGDGIALQIPFTVAAGTSSATFTISIVDLVIASASGEPVLPDGVTAGSIDVSDGGTGTSLQITTVLLDREADEFAFSFQDEEGSRYRIESSTDLTEWQSLGDFTVGAEGRLDFADPSPSGKGSRWFRAVKLP